MNPPVGTVIWMLHKQYITTPYLAEFENTRKLFKGKIIGYSENNKLVCVEEEPDKFTTYDLEDLYFYDKTTSCPSCGSDYIRLIWDCGYWQGYCVSCGVRGPRGLDLYNAYHAWELLCEGKKHD